MGLRGYFNTPVQGNSSVARTPSHLFKKEDKRSGEDLFAILGTETGLAPRGTLHSPGNPD